MREASRLHVVNLLRQKTLRHLEEITNKSNNTLIHLKSLQILDLIMLKKWYTVDPKDVWNSIYLLNYIFDLYEIFKGTFIAQRVIINAKKLILEILDNKEASLTPEQSQEISKMLAFEPVKNLERIAVTFDIDSKDIKAKLEAMELADKIQGVKDLDFLFGKCSTFHEQLKLFGLKSQKLMKGCLADI